MLSDVPGDRVDSGASVAFQAPYAGVPGAGRQHRRERAVQEILHTALRLFTRQGYDGTTIAQIAREAGVAQRTLVRCFGTEEDLAFSQTAFARARSLGGELH